MEELFYQILLEASNKRVYTDRPYNIAFNSMINTTNLTDKTSFLNKLKRIIIQLDIQVNLIINEDNISLYAKEDSNLFIPTLMINNIDELILKLKEYLIYARNFYDKNYYDSIEHEDKTILTLLWSNATSEDFNYPISFLEKRISFLKDMTFHS